MKYFTVALLLFAVAAAPVRAQGSTASAGLTPTSPFYFLESAFETVQGWMIFDPERRAQFDVERAGERLAELEALCMDSANTDRCERWGNKLSQRYEKHMEHAERSLERFAKKRGVQLLANIATGVESAAGDVGSHPRVEALVERLTESGLRHQRVLQDVYARVPTGAKESIIRAMENSAAGLENAMQRIRKSNAAKAFRTKLETTVGEIKDSAGEVIRERLMNKGLLRNVQDIKQNVKERLRFHETQGRE